MADTHIRIMKSVNEVIYMRSFFTAMSMIKAEIRKRRDKEVGLIYKEIETFVESGVYTSYKGIATMTQVYFNGGKDKDVALALGISEPTVRVHKRNISNQLYALFGTDFFSLFDDVTNNEEEIHRRLQMASVKTISPSEIFPIEILTSIDSLSSKQVRNLDYSIDSCDKEIRFINLYNRKAIQRELEDLDKNKLRYILEVLDGRAGTSADRYQLITTKIEIGD